MKHTLSDIVVMLCSAELVVYPKEDGTAALIPFVCESADFTLMLLADDEDLRVLALNLMTLPAGCQAYPRMLEELAALNGFLVHMRVARDADTGSIDSRAALLWTDDDIPLDPDALATLIRSCADEVRLILRNLYGVLMTGTTSYEREVAMKDAQIDKLFSDSCNEFLPTLPKPDEHLP